MEKLGPLHVSRELAGWMWRGASLSGPPVQRHVSFSIVHVTPRKSRGCAEASRTAVCVSSFLCPHLLWPLRLRIGYYALILI